MKATTLRPGEPFNIECIRLALRELQDARDYLKYAKAHNATQYVRRAIKSAEGALRHATRGDIQQKRADGTKPKRAKQRRFPAIPADLVPVTKGARP